MSNTPIYIVAGFLGSGKTTLMQRLLDYTIAQGQRPGVIVNDFGAVNIDAAQLQRKGLAISELSGGCICCSNASQLPPAVKRLRRNGCDLILVETSGLANPIELLDQVTMPWLVTEVGLAGVITVVDVASWADLGEQHELAADQVRCADVLILNKCDLVAAPRLAAVSDEISNLNPAAQQIPTSQAQVDIATLLTDIRHQQQTYAQPAHHDPRIRSLSLVAPLLDRDRFVSFLSSFPAGVLRAKGIVQTSDYPTTSIFQYTPGRHSLFPLDTADTELISGNVVIIGHDLDAAALQAALDACAA